MMFEVFMDIDRKQIMETFIESIAAASDEEYQNRIWIKGQGPECEDFDEFVTYFLHESRAVLEEYRNFEITDTQCSLLKKFEDEVRSFIPISRQDYFPELFLKRPEWKKLVGMAKEILKAFNYQKGSE